MYGNLMKWHEFKRNMNWMQNTRKRCPKRGSFKRSSWCSTLTFFIDASHTQRESCGVVYNFVPPSVLSQFKNATTLQPRPIDLMIGFRVLRQSKVWRAENHSLMRRTNCWVINSLDESLQAITKWRCLTVVISILFSVMIVVKTQVSTNTKMCFFLYFQLCCSKERVKTVSN